MYMNKYNIYISIHVERERVPSTAELTSGATMNSGADSPGAQVKGIQPPSRWLKIDGS